MSCAAAIRRRCPVEAEPEKLDMTPMIDVVFQLLIFFMLTMQFKEVEGKLLSQLPKTHGPADFSTPPIVDEVRIVVCAGGDVDGHLRDKGAHEGLRKDGAVCHVKVERHAVGELRLSETHPAGVAANRAVYRAAAGRTRELLEDQEPGRKRRVILDADSEVAYEHVIGIVDALKSVRLDEVEFVANPRHLKHAGTGDAR